jgi:hypothetical protein
LRWISCAITNVAASSSTAISEILLVHLFVSGIRKFLEKPGLQQLHKDITFGIQAEMLLTSAKVQTSSVQAEMLVELRLPHDLLLSFSFISHPQHGRHLRAASLWRAVS